MSIKHVKKPSESFLFTKNILLYVIKAVYLNVILYIKISTESKMQFSDSILEQK